MGRTVRDGLRLTAEQDQFVELAREFAAKEIRPRGRAVDEADTESPLDVWEKAKRIVVMVTHDIDEALYLSDRLILMTDGPEACVGEILQTPFARPRTRVDVLEHPEYYEYRTRVIDFLENHAKQFSN